MIDTFGGGGDAEPDGPHMRRLSACYTGLYIYRGVDGRDGRRLHRGRQEMLRLLLGELL